MHVGRIHDNTIKVSNSHHQFSCKRYLRIRLNAGKKMLKTHTFAIADEENCRLGIGESRLFVNCGLKKLGKRKKEKKREWERKGDREKGSRQKRKKNERKGGKKIAASGLSRCSWNNFDVCMDEGALLPPCSTPSFPDSFLVPDSFFRGVNSAYHMASATVVP